MLWLDLDTGSVTDSQKRPKGNWVVVMLIPTNQGNYQTTFEDLKRFAKAFGIQDYDIEKIDKELHIWAEEPMLSNMIKFYFGTYFNVFFDDGMIEITLKNNATDETKGQPAPSNTGVDEDELPSSRGGGSGGGSGKGQPAPDSDPSDEGEGDGEDGEGEGEGDGDPSDGDNTSDDPIAEEKEDGEGEGKNPFEEGQKKGKEIPDSLKEKLNKSKGEGKPSNESGDGEGSGEGSDTDSEGGDGQSDSDSQGQGSGQGDGGDTESDSQGSSQGQGEDGEGGEGEGDADGQGEGEGEQGDSDSDSDSGEEGENGEGDSDSDNEGDSDSEKGEKSDKETDKEGKSDESGDNEGESDSDDDSDNESGDGEKSSDDGKPKLSPEGQEILDALKEQCQNARDNAEEAMKEPDSEEAIEQYEDADEALNEAISLCEDEGVNPDDVPEIEEMQKLVEEAEQFAETAAELEDYIEEAFSQALDEGGIDIKDYDEFVKGLISAIYEAEREANEKRKREQAIEALNKVVDKNAVKAVNWNTGHIKYFSKDEVLGRDWQIIQPIFTGLWDGGNEIVVDNTLEGAKKVADFLNIKETGKKSKTSAVFTTKNQDFMDILKRMRMFVIKTDWNNGGENISISY